MKKLILFVILAAGMQQLMAQAQRKVLLEEFTGAWCGFCPYGMTQVERINASYPNTVISIAHHDNDVMMTSYDEQLITAFQDTTVPAGVIDRSDLGGTIYTSNYNAWSAECENRLFNVSSPVNIDIISTYDAPTGLITATVNANFVNAASGDMRISCLLVEDSVIGGSTYNQHNYMGNNGACGYKDLTSEWTTYPCYIPNSLTGKIFTHRNVVRLNLAPSFTWGVAGVIPSSVQSGQFFTHTFTYTLPSGTGWDISHLHLVAFISHYNASVLQRDVLNAQKVRLGLSTVGIAENPAVINNVTLGSAYPNPFNQVTQIDVNIPATQHISVKVYDLLGHEVATLTDETLSRGVHTLYWDGHGKDGASLSNGLYLVRLQTEKQSLAKSIVLSRN